VWPDVLASLHLEHAPNGNNSRPRQAAQMNAPQPASRRWFDLDSTRSSCVKLREHGEVMQLSHRFLSSLDALPAPRTSEEAVFAAAIAEHAHHFGQVARGAAEPLREGVRQ
jgi:hypothetical protein